MLSYAILYGFKVSNDSGEDKQQATEAPLGNNISATYPNDNPYAYCGVNDCQDPEIVNESLDQYQPPNRTSVHILVLVAVSLSLSSISVHALVYPGIGRFSRRLQNIEAKARRKSSNLELHVKVSECRKKVRVTSISNGIDNILYNDEHNSELDAEDESTDVEQIAIDDHTSDDQKENESSLSVSINSDINR